MASTFILTGQASTLSANLPSPIILDPHKKYSIALLSFDSYNSIPNITEKNNKFRMLLNGEFKLFTIPAGAYEIKCLEEEVQRCIEPTFSFRLKLRRNVSKVEITSSAKMILGHSDDFGSVLGIHKPTEILPDTVYLPDGIVNINSVISVEITCNLVRNSYRNGERVHTIHGFAPDVPHGYKIIERPANTVYYPINTHWIQNITCSVVDQQGNILSFQGETIVIRLHLREENGD